MENSSLSTSCITISCSHIANTKMDAHLFTQLVATYHEARGSSVYSVLIRLGANEQGSRSLKLKHSGLLERDVDYYGSIYFGKGHKAAMEMAGRNRLQKIKKKLGHNMGGIPVEKMAEVTVESKEEEVTRFKSKKEGGKEKEAQEGEKALSSTSWAGGREEEMALGREFYEVYENKSFFKAQTKYCIKLNMYLARGEDAKDILSAMIKLEPDEWPFLLLCIEEK